MSKKKKYRVGFYYLTPRGLVGAKNFRVSAKNKTEAEEKAREQFMWIFEYRKYKIQGKNIIEIK